MKMTETSSCPCGKQSGLLMCEACKTQTYCGEACQKADWNVHQQECIGLFGLQKFIPKNQGQKEGANAIRIAVQQAQTGIASRKLGQYETSYKKMLDDISRILTKNGY